MHHGPVTGNAAAAVVGYARAATNQEDLAVQVAALEAVGAARIFTDVASGVRADRPGLAAAMNALQPGQVLTVWKLDRLAGSLPDLITRVQAIQAAGAQFRSLTEAIDTTKGPGRSFFPLIGALAQVERDLLRERTQAGLAHAATHGRRPGRPTVMTPERLETARHLRDVEGRSLDYIADALGVGRGAVTRALTQPDHNTAHPPQ